MYIAIHGNIAIIHYSLDILQRLLYMYRLINCKVCLCLRHLTCIINVTFIDIACCAFARQLMTYESHVSK